MEIVRSNLDTVFQVILLFAFLAIGWATPTDIVIIYALETILIGVFHVIKMLVVNFHPGNKNETNPISGIFYTIFFMVHYGFFVFIQTTFFFVFLSMNDDRISDGIGFENFWRVLQFDGVQLSVAVVSVALFIRMIRNFFWTGRYKKVVLLEYMFVPYLRIIIQQFVAIVPGFFIIFFDGGLVAAILIILLRAALEIVLTKAKHNEEFKKKCADYLFKQSLKANEKPTVTSEQAERFIDMVVNE